MKKVLWLIVTVLVLAACGTTNEGKKEEVYQTVDLKDIETLQMKGDIVLDVREIDEFEDGHIIGAINMPLSQIQNGDRTGLDKDQKYVVVCRSGSRSKMASEILFDEGYDVINVSEGMSTWQGEVE
ncbi:rhodanese-like domain-containing protein [Sporosarcina sp. P17b]|uniref:rhodanese-like domain-containing protein n=1 Tax=Sporosarcina sp. P17b TaxID=2048260 RepID=UPI000C164CBB|nr:rhodanese-like domain-containing protein [Sporosarcina sp. P17b]PIC74864.1 sulfurtransferase [Sporosarcina sp. P17b]